MGKVVQTGRMCEIVVPESPGEILLEGCVARRNGAWPPCFVFTIIDVGVVPISEVTE